MSEPHAAEQSTGGDGAEGSVEEHEAKRAKAAEAPTAEAPNNAAPAQEGAPAPHGLG